MIKEVFDLTPSGIINTLELKNAIYKDLGVYGHFGRDEFPWEKTDRIEQLKQEIKLEASVG